MTEPTISCPQCKTQIKLTESLAAPLVEATRREYEERLEQSNVEFISQALPNVDTFEFIDGIWVTHPRTMIPIACVLPHSLIEVEAARTASEGQQTKAEAVYQYLSGPRFRQRVTSMKDDLEKERKAITRQWAKRDEQIQRVMLATVGMYADLQEDPLSRADYQKLKSTVHTLLEMVKTYRNTEKTKAVLPPKGKAASSQAKGTDKKPPRPGHGRNASSDFSGAKRVKVQHATLHSGNACPECARGRVYRCSSSSTLQQ